MKRIVHYGYDLTPNTNLDDGYSDCVLDNTREPIVRDGREAFESHYPIEWCYPVFHRIDPSRSFGKPLLALLDRDCDSVSKWPTCDILQTLLVDLGLDDVRHPDENALIAFRSMFPIGVADCLAESYLKRSAFLKPCQDAARVVNNPFFYGFPNASERRLVEIAEIGGVRYALDRTKVVADPVVLADEVTMLAFGSLDLPEDPAARDALRKSIGEVLSDYGLIRQGRTDSLPDGN